MYKKLDIYTILKSKVSIFTKCSFILFYSLKKRKGFKKYLQQKNDTNIFFYPFSHNIWQLIHLAVDDYYVNSTENSYLRKSDHHLRRRAKIQLSFSFASDIICFCSSPHEFKAHSNLLAGFYLLPIQPTLNVRNIVLTSF